MDSHKDITLLYYSAHSLPEVCEKNVRDFNLKITEGSIPIVSVTQKPIDFGKNICVGEIGKSYYNCYKQIYIGVQNIKTKYVAMMEDDTLYTMEHFSHRPTSDDVFAFNKHMWYLENRQFWHKYATGMFACIAPTKLLYATLKERFDKYPTANDARRLGFTAWQEPGRDNRLGFQDRKIEYFKTEIPVITCNYYNALGGKHRSAAHQPVCANIVDPWGDAKSLFKKIWGRSR